MKKHQIREIGSREAERLIGCGRTALAARRAAVAKECGQCGLYVGSGWIYSREEVEAMRAVRTVAGKGRPKGGGK